MDLVPQMHMDNPVTHALLQSSLSRGHTFWRTSVANRITTVIAAAVSLAGYSVIYLASKESMSLYSVSPWESTQIQEVYYLDNVEQVNKVSASYASSLTERK